MKIGIIIIFNNYEKEMDKFFLIHYLKKIYDIELCFVNNNSKDDTYIILKEIKKACNNVSIVNIKSSKSNISAIRAGARYLISQNRLDYLGYVNTNLLDPKIGLNNVIKEIGKKQEAIMNFDSDLFKT